MNMDTSRKVEKSESRKGSTTYVVADLSDFPTRSATFRLSDSPLARHLSTVMTGAAFAAAMAVSAFAPRLLAPSLVVCASLTLFSAAPLLLWSVRMRSRVEKRAPDPDRGSKSGKELLETPFPDFRLYHFSTLHSSIVAFAPISLLGAAGFIFMLIVENAAGRAATAAAVLALHASYLSLMPRAVSGAEPSREFLRVRSAVWLATLFFVLAFLYGIGDVVDVPLAVLVFTAGAVAAVAGSALRPESAPGAPVAVVAAFGALGAETFLALWFLPTAWLVDAAVSMILFVLALQAVTHAGVAPAPVFRRRTVFAATLIALVLGTARWA